MIKDEDETVLNALDDMIESAPGIEICPIAFSELKEQFQRVMKERDEAKGELTDA